MSDISEDCWAAGWMMGTEEDLPRCARETVRAGEPVASSGFYISLSEAEYLCRMADELGHWASLADSDAASDYEPYHPKCDAAP